LFDFEVPNTYIDEKTYISGENELVIWQGLGFLAALIPVLIAVLFEMIFDAKFGKGYTNQHHWIWGVSMLVSAPVLWFLGNKLTGPGRELIDPKTGQVVTLRKKHTLFWIPMQYFGLLLIVAGIVRLFI
jgi:hypothetical protein